MNTMTKTYSQLTEVFKMYRESNLNPYHPLIMELVKYEDIIEDIVEMKEDLEYTEEDDIEEKEAIKEEIENLEKRKKRQWSFLMESFVVNTYYHPYLEGQS